MLTPDRIRMMEELAGPLTNEQGDNPEFSAMAAEIQRRNAQQKAANKAAVAAAASRSGVKPARPPRTTSKLSLQTTALKNR